MCSNKEDKMQVSFTGLDILKTKLQEGARLPDTDAMIELRLTNEGNKDLDELKETLKHHKEHELNNDIVDFGFKTENQSAEGITKKFTLNGRALKADEDNAGIFSFFGRKLKEIENSKITEDSKIIASYINTEIQLAMNEIFHIEGYESKNKELFSRVDELAKRLM